MKKYLKTQKKEIWVLGSYSGKRFCDNSKHFFLYLLKNRPEIRAVWLTNSKKIKDEIISLGGESYLILSFNGIICALFSKIVIRNYSLDDVGYLPYFFSRKKTLVNLSHGIPFKRGDTYKRSLINKFFKHLFILLVGREADLVISESKISEESLLLLYDKKLIALTGAPRTDVFFNSPTTKSERTVFYTPTWRDYKFDLLNAGDAKKINDFLNKENMTLYIKWHSSDKDQRIIDFSKYNRIQIASDNVTEFLIKADILITDYSSIFLDYLLLDRPIIFAAFDLNIYEKHRGFHYDYNDITPGEKTKNWDEILINLKKIIEGNDDWAIQRKLIKNKFHFFQDGNSSLRVFEKINSIKKC